MNLRNIAEEFKDYVKAMDKQIYGLYKNPTKKELEDFMKEEGVKNVRYILNLYGKDDVVYVFNYKLLHYEVANHIGIPYKDRYHAPVWGDFGFGDSELIGLKMELHPMIVKEIKKMGKFFNRPYYEQYFSNVPK